MLNVLLFVQVFIVLLAAVVRSEPYDVTHHTQGFELHTASGAVVPQDTESVKAAKAQHFAAKANAFHYKHALPYAFPYLYQPHQVVAQPQQVVAQPQVVQYEAPKPVEQKPVEAKPVVSYAMPTAYAAVPHTSYAFPYTSYYHSVYKREAESEAESKPYLYYGANYYGAPSYYNNYYHHYRQMPYSFGYSAYSPFTSYYHSLYKREAEAEPEADPKSLLYYNQHYAVPTNAYYHVPTTQYVHPTTQYVAPTTSYVTPTSYVYNPVYSTYAYQPYTQYAHHTFAKRDAESDSDSYYYRYYGYPYRYGYYGRFNGFYGNPSYYKRWYY